MEEFVLTARSREEFGSRAARRLRTEGRLPANIYGHGEDNAAVTLDAKEFRLFFEAGHRVATIKLDGKDEHGVLKEVQYDSLGTTVLHVDFSRVRLDQTITMEVPIEIVGSPRGVAAGGTFEHQLHELSVRGPANKVPESFELPVEELKVGDTVRLKDLTAPPDCELVGDPEQVVVAVAAPREEAEEEAAGPAEPEVIARRKEEEESEG